MKRSNEAPGWFGLSRLCGLSRREGPGRIPGAVREGGPGHTRRGFGSRGSATLMVLVFMPILVLCLGLVLDLGLIFVQRALMAAAADFGALAAVQNIDLDRLAEGERYIHPGPARQDARIWTRENLEANLPAEMVDRAQVTVYVINPPEEGSSVHPLTKRLIRDPTVSVMVAAPARLHILRFVVPGLRLQVHADASVMSRP